MVDHAAVVIYDLSTKDSRFAVEVRLIERLPDGMHLAPIAGTVYSCAYSCQLGRQVAINRARTFCEVERLRIVKFEYLAGQMAAWQ